jgi:hypothetical protein
LTIIAVPVPVPATEYRPPLAPLRAPAIMMAIARRTSLSIFVSWLASLAANRLRSLAEQSGWNGLAAERIGRRTEGPKRGWTFLTKSVGHVRGTWTAPEEVLAGDCASSAMGGPSGLPALSPAEIAAAPIPRATTGSRCRECHDDLSRTMRLSLRNYARHEAPAPNDQKADRQRLVSHRRRLRR